MASQRIGDVINFPTALPGVQNASGDQPVVLKNTGNVVLNVSLTGYNLSSRVGGHTLGANVFRAGQNLSSSTQLSHGVATSMGQVGLQSNETINLWLTMPLNAAVAEYYAVTPWSLTGTHS
jgi:hypothetical protein